MNVARAVQELPNARRGAAVGTFDGVHLGHLRVIDAARAAGLRTAVVTFDPHPRAVLGRKVELLTTLERRLELFEAAEVDDVVVLPFDDRLARLEPTDFAERILRAMGAEIVAAGETFRFGGTGRAISRSSRSSASTSGACLCSRMSRRVGFGSSSTAESRGAQRGFSGGRRRSRESWFTATTEGGSSASRPRTSTSRPEC